MFRPGRGPYGRSISAPCPQGRETTSNVPHVHAPGSRRHLSVPTLVIVPTYQEAGTIQALLAGTRSALPCADILVVDDASPDRTGQLAQAAGDQLGRVSVLNRPRKTGLGDAYRDAFRWALDRRYEIVVTMDADLSHDPRSLPSLVDTIEDGADLAIGSRYVAGGSTPDWPAHRWLLSRAGSAYAKAMLGVRVSDATSGYRAYRADALRQIDADDLRARGYGTQVELAHRVAQSGGRLVEVPIRFQDRQCGKSKLSVAVVAEAFLLVTKLGLTGLSHRLDGPHGTGRGEHGRAVL